MKKYLIIISIIFIPLNAFAQNPPCKFYYRGLCFKYPLAESWPPLLDDMPEIVREGYILIDSLLRENDYYKMNDYFHSLSNEELKEYFNYYYHIRDYNTYHYMSCIYPDYEDQIVNPFFIDGILESCLEDISEDFENENAIIFSGLMAHIRIVDTLYRNAWVDGTRHQVIVKAEIIEPIKGKVVPSLKDVSEVYFPEDYDDPVPRVQPALPGTQFQFQYKIDRFINRDTITNFMTGSQDKPWNKINCEFILFLPGKSTICRDSTDVYYSPFPLMIDYHKGYFFPIKDGKVFDPYNQFGFGYDLPVEEYKEKLKDRIRELIDDPVFLSAEECCLTDKKPEVYPNPFDSHIIINPGEVVGFGAEVCLYNIYGACVLRKSFPNTAGALRLSVDALPHGLYLLRLTRGSKTQTYRVMK